jgi:hypothetical protein
MKQIEMNVPSTRLFAVPVDFDEACAFVAQHHRHHVPPQGHKFSIGAAVMPPCEPDACDSSGIPYGAHENDAKIVGVVIVGRPVSRMMQDGWTLEVTRLATDGTKNACSFLYAAAWRATRAIGYRKLTTCILDTEPGTTLRAAGWRLVGQAGGGSWSVPSRPRIDKHPLQGKLRFEVTANK